MSTIWWVRHGPTHRKEMVGWSDVPADLSDTAALARLEAYLPDVPVVSSDLIRAIDTADAIQGARPRLPHAPGLREMNFGAWELRSAVEVSEAEPDLSRAYWDDPEHNRPPGGESFSELAARVETELSGVLSSQDNDLIAVAHFGVILTQIWRARGGSVRAVLSQKVGNLSVTEIRMEAAGWATGVVNHNP